MGGPSIKTPDTTLGWAAGIVANLTLIGSLAFLLVVLVLDLDLFYRIVQEDGALEWATFWAFFCAACVCLLAAQRQRRAHGTFPWFLLGLGFFSLFVAMEEISWGQRLLGYRPPAYFLEHNRQQEFNFHNAASGTFRTIAFRLIIGGYGLLLPLAALLYTKERFPERFGIVAPPTALIPSFVVMLVMDGLDLFTFKREILEFLLGLGMLIAVVVIANGFRGRFVSRRAVPVVVLTWAGVIVLGAATASVSGTNRSADPRSVEVARVELSALGRDFLSRVQPTVCGMHQRIHRYAQHFSAFFLFKGEFAKLTDSGLPAERAQFFLDPWNSPYWVLDECTSGGDRFVIVYSFGPNRRRDSSQAGQLRGDDVGAVIFDGSPPADWSIPGQSTPEGTKPAFPRPVKGDP